jgi:arsenate reductase (glutaredoxin)
MTEITISHNPACGTSRNALALIREDRRSDAQLISPMLAHPLLINRPIVVTLRGVKLCRPSETVKELLP